MRFFPWPRRCDRKKAIEVARDDYDRVVREGEAVDEVLNDLRAMREANHFRIRFASALRGI